MKILFGYKIELEEFRELCLGTKAGQWFSRCCLLWYFKKRIPSKNELNEMFIQGQEIESLYQAALISAKRPVSEEEQDYFLRFMRNSSFREFPCEINPHLQETLFQCGDLLKIHSYVMKFSLSDAAERSLLNHTKAEVDNKKLRPQNPKKSYICVLTHYLRYGKKGKMTSKFNQLLLLSIESSNIIKAYVDSLDMENCTACDAVVQRFIEDKSYYKLLRRFLKTSYIGDKTLREKALQLYPELSWEIKISYIRHQLRLKEISDQKCLGVTAPTMDEHAIILKYSAQVSKIEAQAFAEKYVKPRLSKMTPFFSAWIAYRFPEYGEDCYTNVVHLL